MFRRVFGDIKERKTSTRNLKVKLASTLRFESSLKVISLFIKPSFNHAARSANELTNVVQASASRSNANNKNLSTRIYCS